MTIRPWAAMPTDWIRDGKAQELTWAKAGSAGTAALMVYYALVQYAHERVLRPSELRESMRHAFPTSTQPSKVSEGQVRVHAAMSYDAALQGDVTLSAHPPLLKALMSAEAMPQAGIQTSMKAEQDQEADSVPENLFLVSRLTYDNLNELTTLSRARISAGLSKLTEMQMIWKLDEAGSYGLAPFKPGKWVKLPGAALLSPGRTSFLPFSHFFLRSKHELNAMKLFMYYAYARHRNLPYTVASFETIHKKVGVSERDIPRANSFLLTAGFLNRTKPPTTDDERKYAPNQYFLAGCNALLPKNGQYAKQ